MDIERAKVYLTDLRGLLKQEIPMAAEAIRTLTGPIKIRQEKISGKRGARWIATFNPDLTDLLRKLAQEKGYPDSPALAAIPAGKQTVEVVVDKTPKYELLAAKFKELRDNGASVESIAHAHAMSWQYAKEILNYADTGQRPKWKSRKRTGARKGKIPRHIEIAEDVARMRDEELKPFAQIAAEKGVGYETVCRAYDYARPEAVREAAEQGKTPRRGRYSRLGEDKFEEIRKMLREDKKDAEIAAKVGCGQSTVARERRTMKAEADGDQAA